ncbi:MAG: hypothetical protein NW224_24100 [Leptolyngbyaceae cyanobacterium bins.302]|nr:hypothetical protein [Leptolyngbyaceae cyanobacterium bins.302]
MEEKSEEIQTESFDLEYLDITLSDVDRIRARIKTAPRSNRPTFVFQLECKFGDKSDWVAVFRVDDFDGAPHADILHPDGTKEKIWLDDLGDNRKNMMEAQKFFKERRQQERQRYESELNRK